MSAEPPPPGAAAGRREATAQRQIEELLPQVYRELRDLAERRFRRERPDHTLQPTALVHEAYLRLADQRATFRNRGHFLSLAAQAMRRVLVDHARRRGAGKRGGGPLRLTLTGVEEAASAGAAAPAEPLVDLIDLDRALARLGELDARQARVVELRHFAGATIDEAAAALDLSTATVEREWRMARAWLLRELAGR